MELKKDYFPRYVCERIDKLIQGTKQRKRERGMGGTKREGRERLR